MLPATPPRGERTRAPPPCYPDGGSMLRASDRLNNVAPYALAKVFANRDAKIAQGVDVIDLGVGNPDMRPAPQVVKALEEALEDTKVQNHRYPSFTGLPELRRAIAGWYE